MQGCCWWNHLASARCGSKDPNDVEFCLEIHRPLLPSQTVSDTRRLSRLEVEEDEKFRLSTEGLSTPGNQRRLLDKALAPKKIVLKDAGSLACEFQERDTDLKA
jgi:hypothetical protein